MKVERRRVIIRKKEKAGRKKKGSIAKGQGAEGKKIESSTNKVSEKVTCEWENGEQV